MAVADFTYFLDPTPRCQNARSCLPTTAARGTYRAIAVYCAMQGLLIITGLHIFPVQPAANHLIIMSQVGDGNNFVMIFAGKLLEKAEVLLRMVRGCID